jgi:hypothetical protein
MLLNIDIAYILEENIDLNEYAILYLIYKKDYEILISLNFKYIDEYIKHLIDKKLIEYSETNLTINKYSIYNTTYEFEKLFGERNFFEELYNLYPAFTTRPGGGFDNLKSNKDVCQKIYKQATKNSQKIHNNIIKCLKLEIEERTRTNSTQYYKRLSNWLLQKQWTVYEPLLLKNLTKNDNIGYGCTLE